MSFTYRINVFEPDGTTRATYTPADPIARIDSFSVDANGGCEEATLTVLASQVTMLPRDIVEIETSNDGSTFTKRYLGYVVQAANPHSDDLQTVRCAGMRERLYEITVAKAVLIDGVDRFDGFTTFTGDVAKMVSEAISGLTLPAKVTYSSSDAPLLTFQLGFNFPNRQSLGDLLDLLASTVGEFIVPTGGSYTYDGVTFNAGDTVPAVEWGVLASGALFFRRNVTSPVAFDEADVNTVVDWRAINAEEAVNTVNVIYGTAYDLNLINYAYLFDSFTPSINGTYENPEPLPIVRTFVKVGVAGSERVELNVLAPDPLALMDPMPTLNAASLTWGNPSFATDGDPATFSSRLGGTLGDTLSIGGFGVNGFGQGILLVQYAALGPVGFRIVFNTGFSASPVIDVYGELPETDDIDRPALVGILVGTPRNYRSEYFTTAFNEARIDFDGANDVRVYEVTAYKPDGDLGGTRSRSFAEAYFTPVVSAVASVNVLGINPLAAWASITPLAGSPVDARVLRTSYSVTTDGGAQTTYELDQKYDAEAEAARYLLERKSTEATYRVRKPPSAVVDNLRPRLGRVL